MAFFKVKICGITNLEDALCALKCGADAIGFIFVDSSPRKISADSAAGIIDKLPKDVIKVGVFANQDIAQIKEILDKCKIDFIQFHADEVPDFCEQFTGYGIIKAFRVKDKDSLKVAARYKADAYLLDTYSKDALGGTGKTCNWEIAADFVRFSKRPVILSGGLTPDNVVEAIQIVRPHAVDVSSGVEASAGKKDKKLLQEFIEKAKRSLT